MAGVNEVPYKEDKPDATLAELEVKQPVGEAEDPRADYSGFVQKTDPKEIKLVRKLDMFIMVSGASALGMWAHWQPSLWSMYWLNYLDRKFC